MRVQHINDALNPGKCFIFTDFVQCTYFELQQGNSVTASLAYAMDIADFYHMEIVVKKNLSRGQNGRVSRVSGIKSFIFFFFFWA